MKSSQKTILLIVFLAAAALSLIYQFSTDSLHDDGYFYSKMSQIVAQDGLPKNLPWIYYGTPNGSFTGNHFLFYVLLVPFTAFFGLIYGIKLFTALCFGLLSYLFFAIARQRAGGTAALLALPFLWFGSADFFYRMNLNRPLSLVVVLTLAIIHFLQKNKPWVVFGLCAIFVWLYDGYLVILPIVITFVLVSYYLEKANHLALLGYTVAGIAAGIISHPYFPQNILHPHLAFVNPFLSQNIFDSKEWLFNYWNSEFLIFSNLVLALFFLSFFFLKNSPQKNSADVFYFVLAALFLAPSIIAKRFVDFFAPFTILAGVGILSSAIKQIPLKQAGKLFFKEYLVFIPAGILGLVVVFGLTFNLYAAKKMFGGSRSSYQFYGAAETLKQHAKPGEIIFNAQWDQFPQLFFWNDANYYVAGLNPVFMYKKDPERYWLWRHISNDELLTCASELCDRPKETRKIYDAVKNEFNSAYLFLENERNPKLKTFLDRAPNFKTIYSDTKTGLYKVL